MSAGIEYLKQWEKAGESLGNLRVFHQSLQGISISKNDAEVEILSWIEFGKGISYEGDLLDLAVQANVVSKMGAWFSFNNNKMRIIWHLNIINIIRKTNKLLEIMIILNH